MRDSSYWGYVRNELAGGVAMYVRCEYCCFSVCDFAGRMEE